MVVMGGVVMVATSASIQTCDVAVVGGGILGLAIAALVAQHGYQVRVFRLGDQGRPRADTLRNQGWLQSGLMYVDRFDGDRKRGQKLAARMYAGGLGMLKDLGLPPPDPAAFGIFRVRDNGHGAQLEDDARELRISGVRRLQPEDVQNLLGPVFEEGIFYAIPDLPFPEATVLERIRTFARTEGATFIEVDSPISLVRDENSESGVSVQYGDQRLLSRVTIAAAGAGNFELLQGLGMQPQMEIQQTPLLVVHNCLSIAASIFADNRRGFSFVRHAPDGPVLPDGALVVGTKAHRIVPYARPDERRIPQEDIEKFATHLPACLTDHIERGRFTAGYEVIPRANGRKYFEPWVEWLPGYPGLLLAMPGRATMGMAVAREILDDLVRRLGMPARDPPEVVGEGRWDDNIFMHFHPYYGFNDWDRSSGGN